MITPFERSHGGISALIIDDVIGASLMAFEEEYMCITVNNSIDYKRTAEEVETVIAETSIIQNGTKITITQCEIWSADKSKMIAKGIVPSLNFGMASLKLLKVFFTGSIIGKTLLFFPR